MVGKYGADQDPDCYPDSSTLINLLDIRDEDKLEIAERDITTETAEAIDFNPPPYDLSYLRTLHATLFKPIYPWAGKLRSIDISKGKTRFCTATRIEPEANKLFAELATVNFYEDLIRSELVKKAAELYSEINMLHPFREGNGRAQRILFEHLIINAGHEISWEPVSREQWIDGNIASVYCNYTLMETIFEKCIGDEIS